MYQCKSLNISATVQELIMDGEVCLGKCSLSTARRDAKRVAEYMQNNEYEYGVKLVIEPHYALPYSLRLTGKEESPGKFIQKLDKT